MRILQICSANSIGGGERHVADLCNSLAQRGHEVFVATRPDSPIPALLSGISSHNVFEAWMLNAADVISSSRIASFAKDKNVDIIHAHIARDYPIAAAAAKLSGRPFVLTRHVLFPMKRLQRYVLKGVGAVIAPSKAVLNALRTEGVVPSDKLHLIHNGIDTSHFVPSLRLSGAEITVATIGHLGNIKGHDIFIRAAAEVEERRSAIQFKIIGEDKSRNGHNRRVLTELVTKLKIDDRVDLMGWTDDIHLELIKMDIFVSASRSEPFGLSIAEAMSSGVPVIATASEGASEIIADQISGLIVPCEDPSALADAIVRLAGDKSLREGLAEEGRKRILDQFSLVQMVDRTEGIYRMVIDRHSQGKS